MLEAAFDDLLKIRLDMRDGVVNVLQRLDYEVANAAQLDKEIADLRELKVTVLKDWPWEDRELPAVDRAMVARSREAIARGETGIRVEDLIRDLENKSAK
jgi:hypothetical protein